eukprot:CAMPEP_0178952928 /NCGR_PEP_ID=MMETSP0789-20121207/8129_1 /TAXON_ID=3005 /ORGANISM="Rhizosolenia setigera, Strain CCMP 1694" /LENGTH=214 /DNA_ID=CAMNT_0020634117 /DNA_START=652 /DNA_END=1296 /DNA_ORIENTATION=+
MISTLTTTLLLIVPNFISANIRGSQLTHFENDSSDSDRELQEDAPTLPPTQAPWCLDKRYTNLLSLERTDRRLAIHKMDYDLPSWNWLTDNPIEKRSFDDPLTSNATREALIEFGYTEDMFDCCLNHYSHYDWDEFLVDDGLEQIAALEMLGWTRETHGSNNASVWPDTEFMTWDELNATQRDMAERKLCYTNETWNEVPLYLWPSDAWIPDYW